MAVRVALLGCGGMMGAHAGRLRGIPEAEIVALCDTAPAITEAFATTHLAGATAPAHFTDAVVISTPHTQHFTQGMQALDAGCHVYMEKPMVTALAHAYALDERVRATGKVFVIGYNTPCSPEFFYLRSLIRDGSLGKLELVTGYLSQDWLKLTTGLWRQEPALSGGGQAYDSGAHLFNSLCWSVEAEVAEVFAFVDNHGTAVDINSVTSIRFVNGVLANITIGGNCPGCGSFLAFIFDNGRVEIDGWGGAWIKVWQGADQVKYPPIAPALGAPSPMHNFIDSILGRTEPRTGPRNGIIQSQLMDAIYASQRTGLPAKAGRAVEA